jgi:hypothetical protein
VVESTGLVPPPPSEAGLFLQAVQASKRMKQ